MENTSVGFYSSIYSLMQFQKGQKNAFQGQVFPLRGDQTTQEATAEVRTEVVFSAKVSWRAFLCLSLCLPQFKLQFTQLYQIKRYIW